MEIKDLNLRSLIILFYLIFFYSINLFAQNFRLTPGDTLTSVIIHSDKTVSFKIYSVNAKQVMLGGTDIPNLMKNGKMTKQENGVWEVTIGPLEPGAYRYNFNIDGVPALDPRSSKISESNMNVWSLVYIPGQDYMEIKDNPHGSISEVTYFSKSLNCFRRMHVYTPPGYEISKSKYPVFYLLHGAFDCDDSWSTVGRAGFIMDNLIADKKAVPMIVVMPAGHTGPFRFGMPQDTTQKKVNGFVEDFINDIKPYIENNYNVLTGKANIAIAGLSMGGGQTLDIAIPHLDEYAYFGVFSSGVFGITGNNPFAGNSGLTWESRNKKYLDDPKLKDGLKLVWFSTGKDDFLMETSLATVNMLKKHDFNLVFKESSGGHTWNNWRDYLHDFAQYLFK
jgi:enterochelin esterase family protein